MTRRLIPTIFILLLDILVAFGAVFIAKAIEIILPMLSLPDEHLQIKAVTFLVVIVACYYFQDLYDWKYMRRRSEVLSSVLLSGGLSLIVLALVYFIIPHFTLERNVLLMALFLSLIVSFMIRAVYIQFKLADYGGLRIVVLGDGENAQYLFKEMRAGNYPVIFEGYLGKKNWEITSRYLGDTSELVNVISEISPDKLVVALDGWRGALPVDDLLKIKLTSCDVTDAPSFFEEMTGKILVEEIRPSSIIFTHGFLSSRFHDSMKRIFDVFFALLGLIVTSPVILITAIAIRLDSSGPIFYRQKRVGKDGREFNLIKFRSMNEDAEKDGPQWASEDDQRITRVGKIIRKLRIDEFPQFINVLRNDMSFVGARPERKYFVDQLTELIPYYALRMHTKPGITGWAQVNYPYGDSIEDAKEKLKYELYYMKHKSLRLDLVIIFQTIKIVLKGRGAQ